MEFTDISEILRGKEGEVSVRGWVHHKRSSGGILFLLIRDGSGIIQCTLKKDKLGKEKFEEVEKLPVESVLEIKGSARKDERSPSGYEISIDDLKIAFKSADDFPISKKYHGPDFLLDQRHLWMRSQKMQAILRIRSKLLETARQWFKEHGYKEFHSPSLTAAACEGGSTMFPVKYFEREVYLTQSWQLYAEAAIASLGKIFTVAPSFRAEKSKTRRHLTEFWHMEVEEPFCDLECTMKMQEEFITYICHAIAKEMTLELKKLGREPEDLLKIKPPFPRVTYDKAIEMLQKDGVKIDWGDDITWIVEKKLAMKFDVPFFLTHFPKGVKAFYHKPDPKDHRVTLSADMLAPEGYGEIIGGGQRVHDLDELLKRMEEEKIDPKDYQWYVDLRKYGSVPHSGFGLGVERILAWICKLKHIRDAVAFPRLINRVYP
ncbi:MAG TPA: asparagine--tRNA ligase [archaeon]|nr:asparagine--tRNA ligase [archaeon]